MNRVVAILENHKLEVGDDCIYKRQSIKLVLHNLARVKQECEDLLANNVLLRNSIAKTESCEGCEYEGSEGSTDEYSMRKCRKCYRFCRDEYKLKEIK